jgi:hypothetical protein
VLEHLTQHRLAELYDEAAQDLLGAGNKNRKRKRGEDDDDVGVQQEERC